MTKRINVAETKEKRQTFARALFDGTLPVDMVFSGAELARQRPGILSERAEKEEEE